MITINVTSDSTTPELHVAARFIDDLLKLRVGDDMSKLTVTLDAADAMKAVKEAIAEVRNAQASLKPTIEGEVFNAMELTEEKKLAPSTVDAEVSTTALEDERRYTSIPNPQDVFGQAAQTTENVANLVVAPTVAPVTPVNVDADGLPWDSRIHSSSKEQVKDGTWRKKRGVDPAQVIAVEAELKGVMNVPVPVSHVQPMQFGELLDAITQAMVSGKTTQADITAALASIGLGAMPNLVQRPDLIPAFREALGGVV